MTDSGGDSLGQDELVILVHGTFAGDKDGNDEGPRWWQRGSDTWRWLEDNLPAGVSLPHSGRLFHWSGANTQSARLSASMELLALLVELERKGRPYHLVGHSHGGSVIWEALLTSHVLQRGGTLAAHLYYPLVRRGVVTGDASGTDVTGSRFLAERYRQVSQELELGRLRSWTTIGTPFLCHLPQGGLLATGWRDGKFSLADAVSRRDVRAPRWTMLLALAYMLLVFFPSMVLSLAFSWFELSWIIRLVWLLLAALGLKYTFRVTARGEVAHALMIRARLARSAFARFHSRWLGLYAATDEAISGLRTLCPPDAPGYSQFFVPAAQREVPRKPAGAWPRVPTLLRLNAPLKDIALAPQASMGYGYYYPGSTPTGGAYGLINKWLMPSVNAALAKRLLRTGQGCDVPYTDLVHVSTWPLPLDGGAAGLPDRVNTALESNAMAHAGLLGLEVRQMIARAAMNGNRLTGVVTGRQPQISTKALVHTSYFDDQDVLRMIRHHIATSSRTCRTEAAAADAASDVREWIAAARERVAGRATQGGGRSLPR
ncbi:hypothetical protein ACIGW3_03330 [Streptomyces sp. NPDC053499]|uniref:hypothetical protein n=1 Tax=Streptomyces sp. NPDC053499 TaxID=3365707 RepID=UPI0037D85806